MKQLLRCLSIISSLTLTSLAFAVNPMDGFYGGGFGEISAGVKNYLILIPPFILPPVTPIGRVNNYRVGGGGGAQIGYRLCNLRAEAEVLFNYITAQSLDVGNCRLLSPRIPTPVTNIPGGCAGEDAFFALQTGFKGNTSAFYGMVNAYFDFFSYDSECNIAPYVGAGIGAVRIRETIKFVNTVIPLPVGVVYAHEARAIMSAPAAQAIIGSSFFIDDFTWISIDFRYLTTGTFKNLNNFALLNNTRYGLSTLNFVINFSFDKCTN